MNRNVVHQRECRPAILRSPQPPRLSDNITGLSVNKRDSFQRVVYCARRREGLPRYATIISSIEDRLRLIHAVEQQPAVLTVGKTERADAGDKVTRAGALEQTDLRP